jgi:hypothetical protein
MNTEKRTYLVLEKNSKLYGSFIDSFSCPLCQHKPLEIREAYFTKELSHCFAVFTMSCHKCLSITKYVTSGGDTIEKTKEKLLKTRTLAVTPLISKPFATPLHSKRRRTRIAEA